MWCDARAVVDGIQMLQGQVTSTDFAENEDLWQLLEEQLRQIPAEDFIVKHVPSHLVGSRCESPFEEWIAEHNQHADRVAVMANQNRPEALAQAHARAVRYHCHQAALIRAFRSILFSIAAEDTDHACENPEPHESIPGPSALVWNTVALVDQMPIGWTLQAANFPSDLPRSFVTAVWSMILQQDVQHDLKRRISFIELVFLAKHLGCLNFPAYCPRTGGWIDAQHVPFRPERLTLAVQVKLFRRAVVAVLHHLGLGFLVLGGLDVDECGVLRPCDGLVIGVCPVSLHDARQHLCDFAARRPIRKAADLARPF